MKNKEVQQTVFNGIVALAIVLVIYMLSVGIVETPVVQAQEVVAVIPSTTSTPTTSPSPKIEASTVIVSEVTITRTTPKPKPQTFDLETIEGYIYHIFGYEEGSRSIKMLKECENKTLKTDAINWNGNGSWDFGLYQINSIHGYTQDQLADYKFNTRVAYKIYKNAGYSFSPWTCSYIIGTKSFWQ